MRTNGKGAKARSRRRLMLARANTAKHPVAAGPVTAGLDTPITICSQRLPPHCLPSFPYTRLERITKPYFTRAHARTKRISGDKTSVSAPHRPPAPDHEADCTELSDDCIVMALFTPIANLDGRQTPLSHTNPKCQTRSPPGWQLVATRGVTSD